ncbi:PadR family transcriptional regulator [Arthrobacter sulfonylureivorans]|uniref:PadR family transcriptional regulator n=1 Tax=Arthrobacter sulfonylureivorans TaxID=2486855 RepID=A0ABY3WA22_9MICC|nr:PadR family transcriptional regulator [Arthrobacter sulfonylureivorans]UNK47170.1 PadR family transcriptional regulator [Arthrobacter sulfonylureivorans]
MPPVFAHGALRLYLLALLAEGDKHGYDIIRALSDRFGGTYSPSAGTVYPRLAKLEEEGLVSTASDGRRTVYSITDAGRQELAARQDELADVEADISASVRRLADGLRDELRSSMKGLRADLAASAEAARSKARTSPRAADAAGLRTVKELEHLLNDFRDDVRVRLRRRSATGTVDEVAVQTIRTVLDQAKASITAALR